MDKSRGSDGMAVSFSGPAIAREKRGENRRGSLGADRRGERTIVARKNFFHTGDMKVRRSFCRTKTGRQTQNKCRTKKCPRFILFSCTLYFF